MKVHVKNNRRGFGENPILRVSDIDSLKNRIAEDEANTVWFECRARDLRVVDGNEIHLVKGSKFTPPAKLKGLKLICLEEAVSDLYYNRCTVGRMGAKESLTAVDGLDSTIMVAVNPKAEYCKNLAKIGSGRSKKLPETISVSTLRFAARLAANPKTAMTLSVRDQGNGVATVRCMLSSSLDRSAGGTFARHTSIEELFEILDTQVKQDFSLIEYDGDNLTAAFALGTLPGKGQHGVSFEINDIGRGAIRFGSCIFTSTYAQMLPVDSESIQHKGFEVNAQARMISKVDELSTRETSDYAWVEEVSNHSIGFYPNADQLRALIGHISGVSYGKRHCAQLAISWKGSGFPKTFMGLIEAVTEFSRKEASSLLRFFKETRNRDMRLAACIRVVSDVKPEAVDPTGLLAEALGLDDDLEVGIEKDAIEASASKSKEQESASLKPSSITEAIEKEIIEDDNDKDFVFDDDFIDEDFDPSDIINFDDYE